MKNSTHAEQQPTLTPSSSVLLIVHAPGEAGAHARTQIAQLVGSHPLTIGRYPNNDLVVGSASLSRHHARFSIEQGAVVVEDLKSMNGTVVRGKRVSSAPLGIGETVLLGTVWITVCAFQGATESLWSHDALVARGDLELMRTRLDNLPLCVAVIQPSPEAHD
jgi:hypothetical protein